ncbi:MBL fold metallo-hydrolase [Oceanispirochaeta sp.]|jgi:hydroxyacylglutathione hydrolase|uniref:MBL fold metallo-hydrolase n=1 Tax=Oceanispirochaeta sp. TaxID=2035350 RepID=UPI00262B49A9|nr:MBL fold metallo-hydrolase [Oceanispirochaeta sp.]MDA3955560.1 MBL fold metallo-hydrolase [Oceanispirochaeta sp.]
MKLFNHFAAVGFSNTYLVGGDSGGEALLIDPGVMDVPLLELIEKNDYYIKHILITHSHWNHYGGVNTLLKIYNAQVYSAIPFLENQPCHVLKEGKYEFTGQEVEVIPVRGHSDDSLVYKIGHFYFTGDILSAGRTGTTPDKVSREKLFLELKEKIFSRDFHGIVLPGHGPPSTIKAEAAIFKKYEQNM